MGRIEKQKIILDNNIVNYLRNDDDFDVLFSKLETTDYYVSASVIDEFNNISDEERDKRYLCFFRLLKLSPIPVEESVMVWGISRFGTSRSSPGIVYTKIKEAMDQRKHKKNNPNDAILADTAVSNELVLLTNDRVLFDTMTYCGYKAVFWGSFKKGCQ